MKIFHGSIVLLIFLLWTNFVEAQVHINKEWVSTHGAPTFVDWSESIITSTNEIIHVGNSVVTSEGANILVTKYDIDGVLLWQQDYNSYSAIDDYGVSITEDPNGYFYVIGAKVIDSTDVDVVILKYSANGTLIWDETYGSASNLKDLPTNIIIDANDDIYVSVASEDQSTGYDYVVIKYDNNGTFLWDYRYDYNWQEDIPAGINFDNNNDIFITGGSGTSMTNWDYAVITIDAAGNFINESRDSMPGVGLDKPNAFVKDVNGNIYVTGSASVDGLNYDLKTIKFDSSYNIVWTKTYDLTGNEDVGTTITLDANNEVIVGGYVTRSDLIKNMFIIKYDSNGNELWNYQQAGRNSNLDAGIKKIRFDQSDSNIVYIAMNSSSSGIKQSVVGKLKATGRIFWQRDIVASNDLVPLDVKIDNSGSVLVDVVSEGAGNEYLISKYTAFIPNKSIVSDTTGKPVYRAHELVVRFKRNAVNSQAVDNTLSQKEAEFGMINYYLEPWAVQDFNDALDTICIGQGCDPTRFTLGKIFKQLKTTHTTGISRLGDTIRIPDFWTAFVLYLPEEMDLIEVYNALKSVPNLVAYSEPNYYAYPTVDANDPFYYFYNSVMGQSSLHDNGYPGHINIEPAWDIETTAGGEFIRCGVFDQGINWRHEDFGYVLNIQSSSKIKGGWNFEVGQSLFTDQYGFDIDHGTPVAGIIGAIRNNKIGIAGIAGGNDSISAINNPHERHGVSLYGLSIFEALDSVSSGLFYNNGFLLSYIYDAIVTSSIHNDSLDYGYGLHISNHSWALKKPQFGISNQFFLDSNVVLLREANHFANRMKVVQVAARGNSGLDGPNQLSYPAVTDDDWILNVSATASDGTFKNKYKDNEPNWVSDFGLNVDIGAPGTKRIVTTTKRDDIGTWWYKKFNGTSASAPHVSGVVGLLLTYMNDSVASYSNLAPEDCEHIIQLSATKLWGSNYNDSTGYGRLNAGEALKLVEKQYNTLYHFGDLNGVTSTLVKVVNDTGTVVNVLNRETTQLDSGAWLARGHYSMLPIKVTKTFHHNLNVNDTIVAFWTRPSSSDVFEGLIGDSLLPRQRLTIDYIDRDSCIISGWKYIIYNNPSVSHIPDDLFMFYRPRMEYTILARDSTAPSVSIAESDKSKDQIWLYPNPASQQQTLVVSSSDNERLEIELFDISGRRVQRVYEGSTNSEKLYIPVDISKLNPGIYLYRIKIGATLNCIRFIKR